jgi:hypothetical protein
VEKSLVFRQRAGVFPALALPFVVAAFAAALSNHEPPPEVMAPILALVLGVVVGCWARVIAHWHAERRPDDDDDPWRYDSSDADPRLPGGGPGGPAIDWDTFERDFAEYVQARERPADHIRA